MKTTFKSIIRKAMFVIPAAITLAAGGFAGAQTTDYDISTDAATGAITTAVGKAKTVLQAGLVLGAVFLVARVIRRGLGKAG